MMKERTEQLTVEYDGLGNPVFIQLIMTVYDKNIHLIRLDFTRTFEGIEFEFEIKDGEFGLQHFTDHENNKTYVIAQYEGTIK